MSEANNCSPTNQESGAENCAENIVQENCNSTNEAADGVSNTNTNESSQVYQQKDLNNEPEHSANRDGLVEVNQDTEAGEEQTKTSDITDLIEKTKTDQHIEDRDEVAGESREKSTSVATSMTPIVETPEVSSTTNDLPRRSSVRSSRRPSYNSGRNYAGGFQNYGLTYLPYKSNFEPSEDARRRADEFFKTLKL